MSKSIAGRVAIVPQGEYDSTRQYDRLDVVNVGNSSYIAKKKPPVGTAVTNTTYWNKIVDANWGQIGGTLSNQTDLANALGGKSDTGHTHDGRYYTKTETDTKLGGKSDTGHKHVKSDITDFAHTHDDRYYTEEEVNTLISRKEQEIADLKMLGWVVPSELSVQNYVDSNGAFHQRVGRVNLGELSWTYDSAGYFYTSITHASNSNGYCSAYANKKWSEFLAGNKTMFISSSSAYVYLRNTSYDDATQFRNSLANVYLYYELATEVVIAEGKEKTSGWELIGSVTGSGSVAVDVSKYSTFFVEQVTSYGWALEHIFPSCVSRKSFRTGYANNTSQYYTYGNVAYWNAAIENVAMKDGNVDILATTTMNVYGKR